MPTVKHWGRQRERRPVLESNMPAECSIEAKELHYDTCVSIFKSTKGDSDSNACAYARDRQSAQSP
jgi:hypothetical protein